MNILLVEDDIEVLDVLQEFLVSCGHHVESFENPLLAMSAFEKEPDRFTVALIDHHMPGMTGYEFALRLRQQGRKFPIILSSGNHSPDISLSEIENVTFVDKPYELSQLVKILIQQTSAKV